MADLPLLGCCPTCSAVIPQSRDLRHVQWHADNGETSPPLDPLVEEDDT
jgi:hypothetical protein